LPANRAAFSILGTLIEHGDQLARLKLNNVSRQMTAVPPWGKVVAALRQKR